MSQTTVPGYLIASSFAAKTASYALTAYDTVVTFSGMSGGSNATLPTAVGIAGKEYTIKNQDSTYAVTIVTTSSQTLDGRASSSIVLAAVHNDYITVVSDGANWIIKAKKETQVLVSAVSLSGVGATGAAANKYIGNGCTVTLTPGTWRIRGSVGLIMGAASASDYFTLSGASGLYSADASTGAQTGAPTSFSPAASVGYLTGYNAAIGTQIGGTAGYGSGIYAQCTEAIVTVTASIAVYLVMQFSTVLTTSNVAAFQLYAERVW